VRSGRNEVLAEINDSDLEMMG